MKNHYTIYTDGNREAGYLTLEATLVFPSIFLSLILILFLGMVLYQEVTLQSIAVQASERGSVVYSSRVEDMSTGVKTINDFLIRDPYRNLPFLDNGAKEDYKSIINTYINGYMGNTDVLSGSPKNTGNYVAVEDYLIEKRIKVNIQNDYNVPMTSIPKMFGKEGPFEVNTTAVSAVTDTPDFIRNVDLATDIIKQTDVFDSAASGYKKIKEVLQKLTDLLK